MATILCPNHRPQIGTVRPGVFKKGERDDARQAEIIHEDIHITADRIRTRLVEVIHEMGAENVDLEGAEIIVSGGRGVGGPEGFAPLKELADLVGGVLGASRAAVDSGWTDRQDRGSQGVYCLRHIRGHPACGRNERFRHHHSNQQGPGSANL